jgi:hypothetical protein
VKPGAVVIDVGINRIPAPEKGEGKTRVVGDAHFAECRRGGGPWHHAGAGRASADDGGLPCCGTRFWLPARDGAGRCRKETPEPESLFDSSGRQQEGRCAICGERCRRGGLMTPHATVWKKKRPTLRSHHGHA